MPGSRDSSLQLEDLQDKEAKQGRESVSGHGCITPMTGLQEMSGIEPEESSVRCGNQVRMVSRKQDISHDTRWSHLTWDRQRNLDVVS